MLRALFTLMLLALAPSVQADDGPSARSARIFEQVCAHCHARPEIAPILGDAVEWQLRAEKGFESLLLNTVTGVRGMPPLGSCAFCSEADLRALITLLSGLEDPGP